MKRAWEPTVWAASMVSTHPPTHPPAQWQTPQQQLEFGHLVGLRADQPLRDHCGVGVGGGAQQVGDLPVVPDRAPDCLAVDGQRR